MLEKDVFGKLRRSREDEFFAAREQELIDKLRRHAALEAEVGRMTESKAAANAEILAALEELGYTRETLTLLHLVPLVYVAWAEDFVTGREREQILQAARSRGIDEGSVAFAQLSEWLTTRPSDEFFEKALGIIHTMLEALPPEEESAAVRDLVAYSTRIANTSGGLLGLWGAISAEEQAAIDHVAAALHAKYDERPKE